MLDSEKGTTPALLAISCSPSCQCMASAARQGIAISSATFDHISALNLNPRLASVHSGWRGYLLSGGEQRADGFTFHIVEPVCSSGPHPTRFVVPGNSGNEVDS